MGSPELHRDLHGNYSPLDWMDYFDKEENLLIPDSNDVFHVYTAGLEGPIIFCLHGAGFTGLSFALSAKKFKEKARVVAMDQRGHGKSSTTNDLDLSVETLCSDVVAVLKELYGDSFPSIVLIGHSMGGSIAVHVAAKKIIHNLAGLIVVDVVEGTAISSLIHMRNVLSTRAQFFPTIENAIKWSVKCGVLRNIESARVSIPSTLKYDDSKKCYVHSARLEETEQYWREWYEGLSEAFLACSVPKLLLLAGTDRLDRALTVGQMQGKFQMVIVRGTGHAIQEDVADEFVRLVTNFIDHNRIGPDRIEDQLIGGQTEKWKRKVKNEEQIQADLLQKIMQRRSGNLVEEFVGGKGGEDTFGFVVDNGGGGGAADAEDYHTVIGGAAFPLRLQPAHHHHILHGPDITTYSLLE